MTSGVLAFVVQDVESGLFLCPDGGDVGYTQRLKHAGTFDTREDAFQAGLDHFDGVVDVVGVVCSAG